MCRFLLILKLFFHTKERKIIIIGKNTITIHLQALIFILSLELLNKSPNYLKSYVI